MAELKIKEIHTFTNFKSMIYNLKMRTLFKKEIGISIDEFKSPIEEWILAKRLLKLKYTEIFWSVRFLPNKTMGIKVYLFY